MREHDVLVRSSWPTTKPGHDEPAILFVTWLTKPGRGFWYACGLCYKRAVAGTAVMTMRGTLKLRGFLLAAALLLLCQPAWAAKRVALVLGNSAYQNVAKLPNPVNDSAAIAATLTAAGFDVVDSRRDLPAAETRRALRDFADRARDADIAVVYYAGHGIEVDGTNYLIPVDAKLERDTDVYDEAFSLDRVLLAIEPAKQLRLVILDACRDNPFAKIMKRTVASRAIGQGLAKVEPASPNTLIAYAAKAGSTAADGDSRNSPFTSALVKHITTPGLDVRKALGFVRDDVLKNTSNRQEPYVYGSLGGNDVALVPAKAPAPASSEQADARKDYELSLQIGNKEALNAFLAQYPNGFYANLAKLQLAKIAAEETRIAATEKARLAEQERARLATEGAQQTQQAKAAADAKAAEAARVAAEKAKQAAQEQATAAEQKRAAADKDCPRDIRHGRWQRSCSGGHRGPIARYQAGQQDCRAARSLGACAAIAGRTCKIGANRIAQGRMPRRIGRRRMGQDVAALARTVQQERRHQAGREAREPRCARRNQVQIRARLSADLRRWFQGRRRALRQDYLCRRLVPQRRQ